MALRGSFPGGLYVYAWLHLSPMLQVSEPCGGRLQTVFLYCPYAQIENQYVNFANTRFSGSWEKSSAGSNALSKAGSPPRMS